MKLTRQGVRDLDAEAPPRRRRRVFRRLVECPKCGGAGRVEVYNWGVSYDGGKCLECGGSGKIWVSQLEQRR